MWRIYQRKALFRYKYCGFKICFILKVWIQNLWIQALVDSKSVDSYSVDSKSVDSNSVDSKSVDSNSVDSKSCGFKVVWIQILWIQISCAYNEPTLGWCQSDRQTLTQTVRHRSRSLEVCLCLKYSNVGLSPLEMLIDCHRHRAEYLRQNIQDVQKYK